MQQTAGIMAICRTSRAHRIRLSAVDGPALGNVVEHHAQPGNGLDKLSRVPQGLVIAVEVEGQVPGLQQLQAFEELVGYVVFRLLGVAGVVPAAIRMEPEAIEERTGGKPVQIAGEVI